MAETRRREKDKNDGDDVPLEGIGGGREDRKSFFFSIWNMHNFLLLNLPLDSGKDK